MDWRAGCVGLGLALALSSAALAGEAESERQQELNSWLPHVHNQSEQSGSRLYDWEIKEVWQAGIVCQRQGDNRGAIALYERCRESDPRRIEVLPYLGLALDSEGRSTEAVMCYREYLAQEPDDLVVRFNCAVACYHAGEYAQALELVHPIQKSAWEFEELFSLLGVCYLEQHNLSRALPCLLKAQALKPQCSRVYSNLVSAYVELGDLATARQYAVRALELAPREGAALNNAGVVLEADGKAELAKLAFAAAAKNGVVQAKVNRLLLESARGEADILQAAECADDHPELSQARLLYAWMLMREGRSEEARRELESWHREHDPQPESLMCLGAVYFRLGDYAQALEHYRRSAEMRPSPEAHYNASLCLEKLKRGEEAAQERLVARAREKAQREAAMGTQSTVTGTQDAGTTGLSPHANGSYDEPRHSKTLYDKAIRFVVHLPQQSSETLVSGELIVNGEKFKAASGRIGGQVYGDYWRPFKSPCPPNEATGTDYYLDLCWYDSSFIGGPFYHIWPDPIYALNGQGRRTELGLHEDLGKPGTGGCIGVDRADWSRLRQALDGLSLYNYRLPITVEYVPVE